MMIPIKPSLPSWKSHYIPLKSDVFPWKNGDFLWTMEQSYEFLGFFDKSRPRCSSRPPFDLAESLLKPGRKRMARGQNGSRAKMDETRHGKHTKNIRKRWKITVVHGKTMGNHHFSRENYGKSQFFTARLWNKTMENHQFPWENFGKAQFFMGKRHYFDWAIFNSKLLNYQRVTHKNVAVICDDRGLMIFSHWDNWKIMKGTYKSTICSTVTSEK